MVVKFGEQIVSEIEAIREQLAGFSDHLRIFDTADSFTSNTELLDSGSVDSNVKLTVFGRSDEIDQESAKKMAKFGVDKVSIGFETGSQRVLKKIGKKLDIARGKEVVKILTDCGISVYVNLIYGIRDETRDDLERTVELFDELTDAGDVYRVGASLATPLPNSRWFGRLKRAVKTRNPIFYKHLRHSDYFDVQMIIKRWIEEMTSLKMVDIEEAHQRLVQIADEKSVSYSSRELRGIL